jgi:hypothetical protein
MSGSSPSQKKPPVGPSSGSAAYLMITLAPSEGSFFPVMLFRPVVQLPGHTELTLILGLSNASLCEKTRVTVIEAGRHVSS